MPSQNPSSETDYETQHEPEVEPHLLARFNFFITFDYESIEAEQSVKDYEPQLIDKIAMSIEQEFGEGVRLLFQRQADVKIERLIQGSILGTVVLVVTSGIAVYQFVAQYKDFYESLALLSQQLQSVLSNVIARTAAPDGGVQHTVNVTMTPSPVVADRITQSRSEHSVRSEISKDTLRVTAEDAVMSSVLFRLTKWLLPWYLVLGLIVWGGGAIYGGVQIASLKEQSDTILQESRQIEQQLQEAEAQIDGLIDTLTEDVQLASKEAISTIDAEVNEFETRTSDVEQATQGALDNINEESATALEEIHIERDRAIERLDVDNLPDLQRLKEEIAVLEEAKGRLDFDTYAKFVDDSFIVLITVLDSGKNGNYVNIR